MTNLGTQTRAEQVLKALLVFMPGDEVYVTLPWHEGDVVPGVLDYRMFEHDPRLWVVRLLDAGKYTYAHEDAMTHV